MPDPTLDALAAPELAGITRLSALEAARGRIALAVDLGLLSPGTALPGERALAEAFCVSEITVRRAVKSLADEGVLVRRRGRNGGTFVAERSDQGRVHVAEAFQQDEATVHALIDERALIEAALAHHAALAATPEQIDALEDLVSRAAEAPDWPTYHALDQEFHLSAAAAAGLPWAMDRYRSILRRLYAYFLPYPVEHLHSVNATEHARFVAALRDNDPVRAVAEMQQHVLHLHTSMYVGLRRP